MAYDFFPKNEEELRTKIKSYSPDIQGELIVLYRYLRKKYPKIDIPINLDAAKRTSVNISRVLQEDTKISTIKSDNNISKLSMKFGNGSSGNRGVNNRGNNFEPQFAYELNRWWQGETVSNPNMLSAIENLDETYGLKKQKTLKIELEGGSNTKRPLIFGSNIQISNPKGSGTDVGKTVTDITLTSGNKKIYLSLKLGTTVTFFNVGVRTILSPNDIKSYNIKGDGKKLLDLFGIDETLFCDVFNERLSGGQKVNASINVDAMNRLLQTGIGEGYHVIHKLSGKIVSKKMDRNALLKASTVSSAVIYYGGKGGSGKRIDIEMESASYKFKLNIRDTQGLDGYPTRLMCDFSYK
jgi:hypothetical protein